MNLPTVNPTSSRQVQVLIIGGGPGGYVAGIRAGQLGLEAVVVDGQPLGGTCLNVGCIPSKALIHVADEFGIARSQAADAPLGISVSDPRFDMAKAMAWKDGIVQRLNNGVEALLNKAGTAVIEGYATLVDGKTADVTGPDGLTQRISAEHIVIATGSEPVAIPSMAFGGNVISSTEALSLSEVPDRLAIVGGGYIGLELGIAFAKLGSAVTVVEAESRILSVYDRQLTAPVERSLRALGVEVLVNTKAVEANDQGLLIAESPVSESLAAESAADEGAGSQRLIEADKILVTVGRRPKLTGLGLEHLGLSMSDGFIAIDERCHTSMRNVWAIGDVTGEPMLAHRAMKQGEVVAEAISGRPAAFDPVTIPAIVFTDPEIVTVGLSPEQAKADELDVIIGRFPLSANGRSMTLASDVGFVRAVARADDHLIVGLQAVGRSVAELSTAFGLALEMGARLEDLADTIHAHPTVGEGLAESALAALGHALHI
ncbi:MAG: dihydrolipoyl dehydrogenase [Acidimicrobiales bacterium]